MPPHPARRILAFGLDYLLIIAYAGLLFGAVTLSGFKLENPSPFLGQLIGFVSLTLPVILYFALSENSSGQGSLGKRLFKLKVVAQNHEAAPFRSLLHRNLLKFLPWEMAHFGVHWLWYYERLGMEMPLWVWLPLILSQILVLVYLIGMLVNSKSQTLYELLSKTRVFKESIA